jgi:indolepyruvate ferredoxin oxidoreductase alpha subunit
MEKVFLSGNEAIARGAFEAGVAVGTGYPGTPSTETLESLNEYSGVNVEWSVNEKVALEVAYGAAISGARSLTTMKHVGLNVASDPLFTASYTGIKAGFVILSADDPGMHSSQNEQDNRHYARAAKLPMLEPADSAEAKEFTKLAFEISEKYDTPVILRSTTRLSHSMGIVEESEREEKKIEGFAVDIPKYVMIPLYAKKRRVLVEEKISRLKEAADSLDINRIEEGKSEFGVICSGVPYTYVKEKFPDAAILKLGMVYPLPEKLIRDFCDKYETVYVIEEQDPFFEDQIKAMGLKVKGKECFPSIGEFTPDIIKQGISGQKIETKELSVKIPPRPPMLCQGCPHRIVYEILRDKKLNVTGDIGCYSLGTLPPFEAMHTLLDMGAGFTAAQGVEMAMGPDAGKHTVGIMGDSTFAHSGISGLFNAAYNKRHNIFIVLDNGTTAMTGLQPNPFSGQTIAGEETVNIDYVKLCEAAGMDASDVKIVDAYKREEIEEALDSSIAGGRLSLIVVKGLCLILKKRLSRKMKKEAAQ